MTFKFRILIALLLAMLIPLAVPGQEENESLDFDNIDNQIFDVDVPESNELYKYEPNPDRVRLKSVVDNQVINRFRHGEPIIIHVPPGVDQIVSAIKIEKSEYFKPQALEIRPRTLVRGSRVLVYIPVNAVDRLDYQPLKLIVYQSNVSTYQIVPTEADQKVAGLQASNIKPDFFVRLKPKNGVAVAFRMSKKFRLKNEVFDTHFPFDKIEGIFFNSGEEQTASIVMRNGDNISGKHFWPDTIEFETPWGNEKIGLEKVVSITRNRSVKLQPSGVESPRWIIVADKFN